MRTGRLITFSGIDNSGKSTQITELNSALTQAGHDVTLLWIRGGFSGFFALFKRWRRRKPVKSQSSGGKGQRPKAMRASNPLRQIWITLAILDLLWSCGLRVRYWLWKGKTVICDRYLTDTYVDFTTRFPDTDLDRSWLWRILVATSAKPDKQFMLMLTAEESYNRAISSGDDSAHHIDSVRQRVSIYRSMTDSNDWEILDGAQSRTELAQQVKESLRPIGVEI